MKIALAFVCGFLVIIGNSMSSRVAEGSTVVSLNAEGSPRSCVNRYHAQASGDQTAPPKEHSRMDDVGCCVLKKSQYKREWDFSDDVIRRQCIRDSREIKADYDFYKDTKCDDVKKKINDGTAIPD